MFGNKNLPLLHLRVISGCSLNLIYRWLAKARVGLPTGTLRNLEFGEVHDEADFRIPESSGESGSFFVSEKTLKTEKIADIMKILRLPDLKYRLREYDGKMSEKNGKQKNI